MSCYLVNSSMFDVNQSDESIATLGESRANQYEVDMKLVKLNKIVLMDPRVRYKSYNERNWSKSAT